MDSSSALAVELLQSGIKPSMTFATFMLKSSINQNIKSMLFNWLSLRCFVSRIIHLLPVCWSICRSFNSKNIFSLKFGHRGNYFSYSVFVYTYIFNNIRVLYIYISDCISAIFPGPLLTWLSFNPNLDKLTHLCVGWNYLSISKHQQCSLWSLGRDE